MNDDAFLQLNRVALIASKLGSHRVRLPQIVCHMDELLGGFVPMISHEHKQIGLFEPGQLPANLPAGYRLSIIKALGL